ncbi:MAG TPA: TlpA disulfide reductase family protein [Noviherbaspirillum sp.]
MNWYQQVWSTVRGRSMWARIASVLACAVLAGACEKRIEPPPAQPVEGRLFPHIKLDQSDNVLAARGFQGKVLVLNVWATWCPPCRREMPSLERLSRTLDPNRFAVIGMSTDRDERLAEEFLLQSGVTFANFFDRNGQVARELGLQVYPETFVIAPDGTLVRRVPGMREWDSEEVIAELEAAYQQYASGEKPKGIFPARQGG